MTMLLFEAGYGVHHGIRMRHLQMQKLMNLKYVVSSCVFCILLTVYVQITVSTGIRVRWMPYDISKRWNSHKNLGATLNLDNTQLSIEW